MVGRRPANTGIIFCLARGSLLELETQFLLCQRLNYIDEHTINPVLEEIAEISKMLGSLISKLS